MADIIVTEKDAARFWAKTRRDEATGCLLWTGSTNATGYGHIKIGGKERLSHRVAWILANGDIPAGLFVCHHCDTPPCVEPSHLFCGDHRSNMADMVAKGRSPVGERNGSRTHRERMSRGAAHWMHLRPSMVACGEKSGPAKLTDAAVRDIRAACAAGERQAIVGARHGVTQSDVSNIVHRKTWRHVT